MFAVAVAVRLVKTFNVQPFKIYLKPTAACQTKASSKKKTGITGRMSTRGSKME